MEKTIKKQGYELNIVASDKFKSIIVEFTFRRKVNIDELAAFYILVDILHRGSGQYKSEKELSRKLKENYSQTLGTRLNRRNTELAFSIGSKFIEYKYLQLETPEIFLDLIMDVVFNQVDGALSEENFKIVHKEAINNVETLKDHPNSYASRRLLEVADKDELYALPSYGSFDNLKKVTLDDVKKLYTSIIENDFLEITVAGNIDEEYYSGYFEKINRKNPDITLDFKINHKQKKHFIEEKEDFESNQSYLKILYKVEGVDSLSDIIRMRLFNTILGSAPNSRLFENVREKQSLCYTVNSNYSSGEKLIKINSGINKENYNLAKDLIIKEIETMSSIKEEELETAKKYLIDSIIGGHDKLSNLIDDYVNSKYEESLETKKAIEFIKNAKVEEIEEMKNKIKLDTIFFLAGDKENDEN